MKPADILEVLEISQAINERVWNASEKIKTRSDEETLVKALEEFYNNTEKIILNEIHEKLSNLLRLNKLQLKRRNYNRLLTYLNNQAILYQQCMRECHNIVFGLNRDLTIQTFVGCSQALHRSNKIIVHTIRKILANNVDKNVNLGKIIMAKPIIMS